MRTPSEEDTLDEATVTRTGAGSVRISWPAADPPLEVAVFGGDSPAGIDRGQALARTPAAGVTIEGLDPRRPHYFELVPERGRPLIVGERPIPAEGAVNLRDLGGYRAADGRRVKWGQVFRSDHLARLSEAGLSLVRRLGLSLVCDFRTPAEAARSPDRFPDTGTVGYLHLPIQHGEFEPTATFERIKNGDYAWMTEEFMLQGYVENIERYAPVWATVFAKLGEPRHRPLLFHCTGGKDRAGTCAALILLALGVPEETVVADYGLSETLIAGVRQGIYAQIETLGVDVRQVAPYFSAPVGRIRALMAYIEATYGSAVGYLTKKAGVDEAVIERLRAELLE
jgi:protein-tyrosine phosphatase